MSVMKSVFDEKPGVSLKRSGGYGSGYSVSRPLTSADLFPVGLSTLVEIAFISSVQCSSY